MRSHLTATGSLVRSALRGLALLAAAVLLTVAVAAARSVSQMTLSLSPAEPAPGSPATLTVRGIADETAMPAVVAVSGTVCPARVPSLTYAFWSSDSTLALGAFTRKVSVTAEAKTQRFCAYLQPALEVNGDLQISPNAPLARAELILPRAAEPPLRGGNEPNSGVSGATRDGYGVTLVFDRSGRRIVMLRTVCGGSALHPPALGLHFIGKRFNTRLSLPLTRTIHWSGLIQPDNSKNYDPPPPVAWTKPTHFSLNVRVVSQNGLPRALVGTGVLSSPGLTCPKIRHYVFP